MSALQEILDEIFADASCMQGSTAPWAIEPNRLLIAHVKTLIEKLLAQSCDKRALTNAERRVKALIALRDARIECDMPGNESVEP